jgi:16S rRNA (guanine966-N2)-methyltransferase
MRVIAGSLGGRMFDSPNTHRTHPMSDKARGALFNMLGELDGLSILDAFAGTGALSFEAISRGAKQATAIEQDRPAQQIIERNIKGLGLNRQGQLIKATSNAWLQTNPDILFDIVLCDPPYEDLQPNLLAKLAERVKNQGLLVLSWPGSQEVPTFSDCELVGQRSHGDMQLAFYRKIK